MIVAYSKRVAKRILVVDDDRTARSALSVALREEGYEVAVAGDGEEARDLADRLSFDLVVTDLAMPRLDGLGLIGHLKRAFPELPVMVVTATTTAAAAQQAKLLGAAGFVNKPVELDEFLEGVAGLLAAG